MISKNLLQLTTEKSYFVMRLSGLLSTLEQSIAKYGYKDYLHHQNELLPSLIEQVRSIPRDTFGTSHFDK